MGSSAVAGDKVSTEGGAKGVAILELAQNEGKREGKRKGNEERKKKRAECRKSGKE